MDKLRFASLLIKGVFKFKGHLVASLHVSIYRRTSPGRSIHLSCGPPFAPAAGEPLFAGRRRVEKIIADLQGVGLLEGEKDDYILPDEPEFSNSLYLENLARTFEQPLPRQELSEQIKQRPTPKVAPKPRSKLSTPQLQKTTAPA